MREKWIINAGIFKSCCLLFFFLVLSGCQPPSLTEVSAFGNAASKLADGAQKDLDLIDSSTVTRTLYDIASNCSEVPIASDFTGIFSQQTEAKALKARLNLLSHLGGYASALQQLATADLKKDIDTAATNLYGSLKGVRDDYNKVANRTSAVSDQNIQVIAAAVDSIGSVIAERKRRTALRVIVENSDPGIQEAALLIATDLGKDSQFPRFVHANLVNAAGSLQSAYGTMHCSSDADFYKRYQMLGDIQNMYKMADSSLHLFSDIASGAQSMAHAHTALLKAVQANDFTSSDLIKEVGDMVNSAESVEKFYGGLATAKKQ